MGHCKEHDCRFNNEKNMSEIRLFRHLVFQNDRDENSWEYQPYLGCVINYEPYTWCSSISTNTRGSQRF